MKARKRIEELVSCVGLVSDVVRDCKESVTLADIGADHGWVSFYALKRGVVDKCILSDISASSLEKARGIFALNPDMKNKAKFLIGDGFEPFLNEKRIDIAVIAGMGGAEILKIIGENAKHAPENSIFVLQARHDEDFVKVLKKYAGLEVFFDRVIFDHGHVYRTIVAGHFANSTGQRAVLCDKLRHVFENPDTKKFLGLDIDFEIFGVHNLLSNAHEHVLALEFLRGKYRGIRLSLEKNASKDDDIVAYVKKLGLLEKYLDTILKVVKK